MNALQILKDATSGYTKDWAIRSNCESDELFGKRNGTTCAHAAWLASVDRKVLLKEFHKLAKEGIILRFHIHSGVTLWWPVGYLDELRSAVSC